MKIRLTEACGIVHEADAEITGVNANGYMIFVVTFPVDGETLMGAEIEADEIPLESILEVRSMG